MNYTVVDSTRRVRGANDLTGLAIAKKSVG
jgi:hypothetical protein